MKNFNYSKSDAIKNSMSIKLTKEANSEEYHTEIDSNFSNLVAGYVVLLLSIIKALISEGMSKDDVIVFISKTNANIFVDFLEDYEERESK